MAYCAEPCVTWLHATGASSDFADETPYFDRSTRLCVISNDGSSKYSIVATSGAPDFALIASLSLTYSAVLAKSLDRGLRRVRAAASIFARSPNQIGSGFCEAEAMVEA